MIATRPLAVKPGTNKEANQKHSPLTTSEKPPNVKKLSGKDKRERTGLTPELTSPRAIAAMSAAGKVAILTPGTTKSITSKLKAVAKTVSAERIMMFSLRKFCRDQWFSSKFIFSTIFNEEGLFFFFLGKDIKYNVPLLQAYLCIILKREESFIDRWQSIGMVIKLSS